MINNRQAGRRRGRGGQRSGNNPGRPDNGNRIDNRARGNAAQLLEKYKNLARDAQMSGDRVNTEYYLQFADHYFRVLNESRARFEENRRQRGDNESEEDEEFGFEGEPVTPDAYQSQERDNRERDNREPRGDRENRGQREFSRDRDREPRELREPRNGYASYGNGHANGFDAAADDQAPVAEARPAPDAAADEPRDEALAPAPERPRRGRPRKVPVEAEAVEPSMFDVDRLPPSLSTESTGAAEAAEERPRRTRRRRTSDEEVTPPTT
ncbi:DUF4167 domain-containing protein [Sphingomonas sp. DT-204]|uniref:DUF4167 domain-containing protein n=1 Tax=Sphingomonas sp. DT-204 TaxID=3396166 RepID=UPI003F1A4F6E